jgi:hypothetical protein
VPLTYGHKSADTPTWPTATRARPSGVWPAHMRPVRPQI